MRLSEIAKTVVDRSTMALFKFREIDANGFIQYNAKNYEGSKKGWAILDLFTASSLSTIYDALSTANQEKFDKLPVRSLMDLLGKINNRKDW